MNLDIEALKADALAAVPGPYTFVSNPEDGYGAIQHYDNAPGVPSGPVAKVAVRWMWLKQQEATGRMFAALHPAAVLALIERLERAEALEKLVDTINGFPDIKGDDLSTLRKRFSALYAIAWAKERHLEAVQRDLDALRASANPDALESERQANAMLIEENDRLQKAFEAARAQIPESPTLHHRRIIFTESAYYDCWKCYRALVADGIMPATRMVLCPVCGNKRCPKASDHDLPCTGSNEPGQPGSIY